MSENKKLKSFVIIALIVVIAMMIAIVLLWSGVLTNLTGGSKISSQGNLVEIGNTNIVDNTISNKTNTTNTTNTTGQTGNTVATKVVYDETTGGFVTNFLKMENESKNIIYSPLSIQYALHMLKDGAKGETKAQIEKVIGDRKLTSYKNIDKVLSLGNAIFIRDTYQNKVLGAYKNLLKDNYNADVLYDNFKNADNVNNWIKETTMGIIPKLLDDRQVQDPNLKVILANALAIDMEWKEKFEEEPLQRDFNKAYGDKVKAAYLTRETKSDTTLYYKGEGITALAMDLQKYGDNEFQFIAVMPDENISKYINEFTYSDLEKVYEKLIPASKEKDGVNIYIPRFEYEYDLKLKTDLLNMGITDTFDSSKADLTGITGEIENRLYVDDALHKAKIEFTYKGVKAAAVTVLLMKENAMIMEEPKQPVIIDINKPFIYIIRDKVTGEVWFMGATFEPMTWEKYQEELKSAESSELNPLY